MGKILGLDIGTNSIGWALIESEKILGMGSRIVPMGIEKIDYEKGVAISKNADRREARTARKMNKRYKQRRNKLLYVLSQTGMLPTQLRINGNWPEDPKELQKVNLLRISEGTKQLTALESYKLRCDALEKEISLQELGRIFYRLNQLRGYNGGNANEDKKKEKNDDNEEESASTSRKPKVEYRTEKFIIIEVSCLDEKFKSRKKGEENKEFNWFEITVLDSDDEKVTGRTQLQDLKPGEEAIELQLKISHIKGRPKLEFSLAKETDWKKKMKDFDEALQQSGNTPGQEFYKRLKESKWQRIKSQVVLRHRYKNEFDKIWENQAKYHQSLDACSNEILTKIACYLFPGPSKSQEELRQKAIEGGLRYIIKEQIIYYQRDLKAQTVGGCSFETETDSDGKPLHEVVPVSHPLYQEFRIWDKLNNLYITTRMEKEANAKEKQKYYYFRKSLDIATKVELFEKLQEQKELKHGFIKERLALNDENKFLNGLHYKASIKGNETLYAIRKSLGFENYCLLQNADKEVLTKLWLVIYYGKGSEYETSSPKVTALKEIFLKTFDEQAAETMALKLAQEVSFPRKYGNYSEKALQNILCLIRCGENYYDYAKLSLNAAEKIETVRNDAPHPDMEAKLIRYIQGSYKNSDGDDVVENKVITQGGMQTAFALMLLYNQHNSTRIRVEDSFKSPENIISQIREKKPLRNPIVEQMLNETLHLIKEIWKQYKEKPEVIKLELARELKNNSKERAKIYDGIIKNEKANKRVRNRLRELGLSVNDENILKYKLCEQQNFISPYTGQPIPLNDNWGLFSGYYDIDHIIPKSRFFDDSATNKVVCERHINEDKGNRTAWEYLNIRSAKYTGQLLTTEKFIELVETNFKGRKKANLLRDRIPENFVERQIKDTQFISREVRKALEKIVGTQNVKTTGGGITDYLRSQWGLRKLFMLLTQSRYKQMALWTNGENWITNEWQEINGRRKKVYEIKHWSKRHDHRHHAIDALVVALTEPKHIHRLNNLNKELQERLEQNEHAIQFERMEGETLFEAFLRLEASSRNEALRSLGDSLRKLEAPFCGIIPQAKVHLQKMIISHKPQETLRIQKGNDGNPTLRIKGPLHNETIYGKTKGPDGLSLAEAYRIPIEKLSTKNFDKLVSGNLKAEILAHKGENSFKDAFSGEGLISFNEKRKAAGKHPVYAIKIYKEKDTTKETTIHLNRERSQNTKQSVESGSNYCLVVLEKAKIEKGKTVTERLFKEISLFEAAKLAQRELSYGNLNFKAALVQDFLEKHNANKVLFTLMKNDLVYLPVDEHDPCARALTNKELENAIAKDPSKFSQRVYRVVKITDRKAFFMPHTYARPINIKVDLDEGKTKQYKLFGRGDKKDMLQEFGSFNEASPNVANIDWVNKQVNGSKCKIITIQDSCIKIDIDRLGNVRLSNAPSLFDSSGQPL